MTLLRREELVFSNVTNERSLLLFPLIDAANEEHSDTNHKDGKDDDLRPHDDLVTAWNRLPWNDLALHVVLPGGFDYRE